MDGDHVVDSQAESKSVTSTPEAMPNAPEAVEQSPNTTSVKGAIQDDEASRLRELEASIRDQDDLERDIGRQVRPLLRFFLSDIGSNEGCRPINCSWSRRMSVTTRD